MVPHIMHTNGLYPTTRLPPSLRNTGTILRMCIGRDTHADAALSHPVLWPRLRFASILMLTPVFLSFHFQSTSRNWELYLSWK